MNLRKATQEEKNKHFIDKAHKKHPIGRYGYDLVRYVNTRTEVSIICNGCGKILSQLPHNHYSGSGCLDCSNEEYWKSDIAVAVKENSRRSMIKHCHPVAWSEETNKKRAESRKGYKHTPETLKKMHDALVGRPLSEAHRLTLCVPKKNPRRGFKLSESHKNKISKITSKKWEDGLFKIVYQSKGELEMISILKELGYDVITNYRINRRPYDAYIKEKNLIIEFNGKYWHRDPRYYPDSEECRKIWEWDRIKMDAAKNNNHNTYVIWQSDWETCKDKPQMIKDILNGY